MINAFTTTLRRTCVVLAAVLLAHGPLLGPPTTVAAHGRAVFYAPNISLVPYAARPGQMVEVQGHGFVPGETVRLLVGQASLTHTQAATDGTIRVPAAYRVPYRARPGYVPLSAIGEQSQQAADQRLYVMPLQPWAVASAYVVHTGDRVFFNVYGFAAREAIDVYTGMTSLGRSKGATDATGHLAQVGPFRAPGGNSAPTYTFVGARSGARLRVTLTWLPK